MNHDLYMTRALELATLGRGFVSPNPMVGCVIVHDSGAGPRIIGEGWHQRYGEAHAEVNAIRSVKPADEALLPESTVYVTLEPCSHIGKTPPCADLLIHKRVERVIVCNKDSNPLVAGRGLARLQAAGIAVETDVLAQKGRQLNRRFFTQMERLRPYVILKWAETSDGFISGPGGQPVAISGPLAGRLVHRWRTEEPAIMVGSVTARTDNPRLNARLWPGANPVRIVLDKNGTLPPTLCLFDGTQPTLCYTYGPARTAGVISYVQLRPDGPLLPQVLNDLHQRGIQSILVEGGTILLTTFLNEALYDELRVFRSPLCLGAGTRAPLVRGQLVSRAMVGPDELSIYQAP